MIRAVCFDFGNVLAAFDHRRAVRRLAPSSTLDERTLFETVYNLALEHDYEAGRLGTAEFVTEAKRVGRLSCSGSEFLAAYVDIFTPNDELCALIPRLKPRYKLLLASNTNEAHARQFRQQFGETLKHFDALILSYKVGVRKPRLPYFDALVQAAGCAADECLFIDDLALHVLAAQAAGLKAFQYVSFTDLLQKFETLGIALP